MAIKRELVESVKKVSRDNGGIYVPPSISPDKPLFFAIDNIDLNIDTPDGKDQLHGSSQVIFQEKDPEFQQGYLSIETKDNLTIDKKPLYMF